jgi:hypothetical protein
MTPKSPTSNASFVHNVNVLVNRIISCRDVTKLLYIYEAVGTDPELRQWKMQWSEETPYDARDDNTVRAGRATNDIIKALKQNGTRYFTTNYEYSPMCNRIAKNANRRMITKTKE